MRLPPICQRIWRRSLLILAMGFGLVQVTSGSCNDQVTGAALTSLQDLALQLVSIFFDNITLGTSGTDGATTVQAITHTMSQLFA